MAVAMLAGLTVLVLILSDRRKRHHRNMSNLLNTPERILRGILAGGDRMGQVDTVLGDERLLRFCEAVSRLTVHQEPRGAGLTSIAAADGTGAMVCLYVLNAVAELDTAWHLVRLGNVPASQRQGRVAAEALAAAGLLACPRQFLLGMPSDIGAVGLLKNRSDSTIESLLKTALDGERDDATYVPPALSATQTYASFIRLLGHLDAAPAQDLAMLQQYRTEVQHPASHGTFDLTLYHFEGIREQEAPRSGAFFDVNRAGTYIKAAEDLIGLTDTFTSILYGLVGKVLDKN